jgi:hypothetical protein
MANYALICAILYDEEKEKEHWSKKIPHGPSMGE